MPAHKLHSRLLASRNPASVADVKQRSFGLEQGKHRLFKNGLSKVLFV